MSSLTGKDTGPGEFVYLNERHPGQRTPYPRVTQLANAIHGYSKVHPPRPSKDELPTLTRGLSGRKYWGLQGGNLSGGKK
jgi:hypothetical protein